MQKQIILGYLLDHPAMQLVDFYVDEGVSGTTYERPAFRKMLEDAKQGKVGCVIIKDVSRFGRSMIDTGFYVERVFPQMGVRFISINDNYDSAENSDDFSFALKSLVSEAYSLDIGRKVKAVIHHHITSGDYIGNRPPFGYLRSEEDGHKLVVDEPAAAVVQQIYEWASNGKSVSQIVRILNQADIPTPSRYWFSRQLIDNPDLLGSTYWQPRTVQKILSNETYTGTMVQGKTKIVGNARQSIPSDEWIRVADTHSAIIPYELFHSVQNQIFIGREINASTQAKGQYSPNIFKGKIFCAHCGGQLERKKSGRQYIFRCVSNYSAPGSCEGNRSSEDAVIEAVSHSLLSYADVIANEPLNAVEAKHIGAELVQMQVEASYEKDVLKTLFEAFSQGKITQQEFGERKSLHHQKDARQKEKWAKLMLQQNAQRFAAAESQERRGMLQEFRETMVLTQDIVDKLVCRIGVHNTGQVALTLSLHGDLAD